MNADLIKQFSTALRILSVDMIESASSGHPGMPLGMADIAAVLFSEFLKFNPQDPKWSNRDRFVISNGHGSALLYSLLYLTGYEDINIEDIKNFRQLHSKTCGHPEYGKLSGIEATTGCLGQGLANAVGMAFASKKVQHSFPDIINHKTYCFVGDGCLMEGISQEAISFASQYRLNDLVVILDDNSITIDGSVDISNNQDQTKRFIAAGWDVVEVDGHDIDKIFQALSFVQNAQKPTMIKAKTVIGRYAGGNIEGKSKAHGAPLGKEAYEVLKKNLNWNFEPFSIPNEMLNDFKNIYKRNLQDYNTWQKNVTPEFIQHFNRVVQEDFFTKFEDLKSEVMNQKPIEATRISSQRCLGLIQQLPFVVGGSADLTSSVMTKPKNMTSITPDDFSGKYIHYGVCEHFMAAAMNGMYLYGGILPYGGTFLVFSDYLKPAIRLSALMNLPVIYVFTHDSIMVGEDGPTHQPIEHLDALSIIPDLLVFRPADSIEMIECYKLALQNINKPSAIICSRQKIDWFREKDATINANKGAYFINDEIINNADYNLIATGSEVSLALLMRKELLLRGISCNVVSMPCTKIFDEQNNDYKNKIFDAKKVFFIQCGSSYHLMKYSVGKSNIKYINIETFGECGKGEDVSEYFGFDLDSIINTILK